MALATPASAASKLTVQAVLRTAGGALVSGTHDMTFRLFDSETGGTPLWQQQVLGVTVQDGLLDVELGPFTTEPFASHPALWVEAQVGSEVLPRRPLQAVARALVAEVAGSAAVASALDCTGCVGGPAIPGGAIAAVHLQDGAVTAARAGFPWALGDAPGGAAKDLACTGCVGSADLAPDLALKGDTANAGSLSVCTTPYSGCGLGVGNAALRDTGNGWLTVLSADGVRVRNAGNSAHRPLEFGGGASFGALSVTGDLTVSSGKLGVGTTAPTQAADIRGGLVTTGGLMGGFSSVGSSGYHPDATLYLRDTGWWLGVVSAGATPWDDQDSFVWNTVPNGRHFAWTAGGVSNPLMLLRTDGRLGVGTTSPAEKVDVAGTVKAISVQVGNDAGPCNGGRAGTVRWSGSALQVCDGSAWTDVGTSAGSGSSQQAAGLSCEDILQAGQSVGDGVYWIDPNGGATSDAFQVWCDMTRDGGGWTLVHKTDKSGSGERTDGGFNTAALTSPAINGVAALPRATMAALGQVVRVESTDGKTLFWSGAPYYTTDAHDGTNYTLLTGVYSHEALVPGTWAKNGAHSLCVAYSSVGFSERHICGQRWCCGSPNAGLWFNGGGWAAGYYAGAVWVRKTWIPPAQAAGDGTSPNTPGASCAQILANGLSTGDKAYWLDPTGPIFRTTRSLFGPN